MAITAAVVNELRQATGCGLMDCKKALIECEGDMEKAVMYLREKGLASQAKKASRVAAEGMAYATVIDGVGVVVEVNCETDFVAKTPEFKSFVRDIAMHIAAANPSFLDRTEVPNETLDKEREILRAQALNDPKPKPANIIEKMVEGRIAKYYKEVCLLEQPFVKNPDQSIEQMLKEHGDVELVAFVRFEMGEGLQKRQDNFAEEVMGQMKK